MLWYFSLGIPMLWFFSLGILMSWNIEFLQNSDPYDDDDDDDDDDELFLCYG